MSADFAHPGVLAVADGHGVVPHRSLLVAMYTALELVIGAVAVEVFFVSMWMSIRLLLRREVRNALVAIVPLALIVGTPVLAWTPVKMFHHRTGVFLRHHSPWLAALLEIAALCYGGCALLMSGWSIRRLRGRLSRHRRFVLLDAVVTVSTAIAMLIGWAALVAWELSSPGRLIVWWPTVLTGFVALRTAVAAAQTLYELPRVFRTASSATP